MAARLIGIGVAVLALASPAAAQSRALDRAAASLPSDPVYVHPGTDALTQAQADELRGEIDQSRAKPIFVAILPASARREAGGSSSDVALQLGRLVGESGVYAVIVGNQFRAVSNDLPRDQAGALAIRAFLTHNRDGVAAVLLDFIRRAADIRAGRAQPAGGGGAFPSWLLLGTGALAALLALRAYRSRQRQHGSSPT